MYRPTAKRRLCWSSIFTPSIPPALRRADPVPISIVMATVLQRGQIGLDDSTLRALYSKNGTVLPLKGRRKEEIFKGRR